MDNRPIGVFDSGLGGLTVAKQLMKLAPNENIVYLGDTARAPYGMRSQDTIVKYGLESVEFLKKQGVKMAISACGTISCAFLKAGTQVTGTQYMDILAPTATQAYNASKNKRIGVIGTAATVNSGAFKEYLQNIDKNTEVFSLACPLFVSLVEYGFVEKNDPITVLAVERYIQYFKDKNIDTLILGCTHFPLLYDFIADYLGAQVALVDPGVSTAKDALTYLKENDVLCEEKTQGQWKFFGTDSLDNFNRVAKVFLNTDIKDQLEQAKLGDESE